MNNNLTTMILATAIALILSLSAGSALAVTISSINLNPSSGKAPLDVQFSAAISGTGPYTYAWDLGDGFTSTKDSFSHQYSSAGTYTVTLNVMDSFDNSTDTQTSAVTVQQAQKITISLNANPLSGNAPLTVSFAAAVTGEEPLSYEWDFNDDGKTDSKEKNPSYTYSIPDTYASSLKITDSSGNTETEDVNIYVTKFDPKIAVDSYSPKSFNINGDVTMSIIVANTGNEYLSNIDAKTISDKVVFKKSSAISSLAPGDKDSITLTFNPISAGSFNLPVKILGKNFNLAVEAIDVNKQFSAAELQSRIDNLSQRIDGYEQDYLNKKATGYLVGDVADSIKSAKEAVQTMKQNMIVGRLSDVNNALKLIQPQLDDIDRFLKEAKKPKKSFTDIIKENALWVTTVLAAFAGLGGFIAKMKAKAKTIAEKAHHHLKSTFSKGKEMPQAAHEAKEHEPKHDLSHEHKQEHAKEKKPKTKKLKSK